LNTTEFDEAMVNWVRWVRSSPQRGASCKSLESRYRCPQVWHAREPSVFLDTLEAERVEGAVVSLPLRSRTLIIYSYLKKGMSIFSACRQAGIAVGKFDERMSEAKRMLMGRL